MEMFLAPLPVVKIFHNLFVLQDYNLMLMTLRGYIFQKQLLARNVSCINKKNVFFIKETDTFGHVVYYFKWFTSNDQ